MNARGRSLSGQITSKAAPMPDRPPPTPRADETTRQATDEGALRDKVAAQDPAAVPLQADSEAAGTPTPVASAAAATEAQAKQAQAAVPHLDRDRAVSTAQYRKLGAPRDRFLAAFIACLGLCAGVTAIFLVFALP
jgi:hypothetical protein